MQPDVFTRRDFADCANRIDGTSRRVARGSNDRARTHAGGAIARNRFFEKIGAHAMVIVARNLDDVRVADAEGESGFFGRDVRVFGTVNAQPWKIATGHAVAAKIESGRL